MNFMNGSNISVAMVFFHKNCTDTLAEFTLKRLLVPVALSKFKETRHFLNLTKMDW